MLAVVEVGKSAEEPGPMICVRQGTEVQLTLTNRSDSAMVIGGVRAGSSPDKDTGRLAVALSLRMEPHTMRGLVVALQVAFADSVDDYLAFCATRGEAPEKPFSGRFPVRVDPGLHRQIAIAASVANESLNSWVAKCLERGVTAPPSPAIR